MRFQFGIDIFQTGFGVFIRRNRIFHRFVGFVNPVNPVIDGGYEELDGFGQSRQHVSGCCKGPERSLSGFGCEGHVFDGCFKSPGRHFTVFAGSGVGEDSLVDVIEFFSYCVYA